MENSEEIPKQSRRSFLTAAWVVAGIITVISNPLVIPIAILSAWMFPFGGFRLVFSPDDKTLRGLDGVILIGGWLFYGCLTRFAFLQSRVGRFFIVYGVLCVFLVLNAVGCNKMLNDPIKDSL